MQVILILIGFIFVKMIGCRCDMHSLLSFLLVEMVGNEQVHLD